MKNMDTKTTKWQRASKVLLLCLVLAAAVFYRDSLTEIYQGIRQTQISSILISIGLSMAAYLMEGMTITCMAGAVIPVFSVKKGTAIAYLCEFYRMITLGNGSGFMEIHYLHKSGLETGSAAGLTMLQYMLKRTAVMVLGILGFGVLYGSGRGREICREYAGFMAAGMAVTVGVIAVFAGLAVSEKISGRVCLFLDWLAGKTAVWEGRREMRNVRFREEGTEEGNRTTWGEGAEEGNRTTWGEGDEKRKTSSWEERFLKWKEQAGLLNQAGKLFFGKRRRALRALLFQMGKMLLFYAIPASLLYGKCRLTFGESVLLTAVAYMLAGIIPVPSGAGALEFVFVLFFAGFAEEGTALPAILLFRFATWVLPFAVGGVLIMISGRKNREGTV